MRLDSRLEALNRAPNAPNVPNRAPNAPNVLIDIDAIRTEIQYLVNDVRILEKKAEEGDTEFTQEDFAMAFNNPGLVHLLLANPRIDPNNEDFLKKAIEQGQTEIVRMLLPRVVLSVHNNALVVASVNGHTEIVRILLADPRVDPAYGGNYAFENACARGHIDVVRLLLPRINPAADYNCAIELASSNGQVNVVRLLLADPRVIRGKLKSAIEHASTEEIKAIIRDAIAARSAVGGRRRQTKTKRTSKRQTKRMRKQTTQ